jgi:hypothetical protein
MLAAVGEDTQHKYGVHKYSMESFGLSGAAIDNGFAAYISRHDLGENFTR